MAQTAKASFKNSRITPRSATLTANAEQGTIAFGANTLVAAQNVNRTYLSLRVESGSDIRYDYFDNVNILTEGFLLKSGEGVDIESTEAIYAQGVTGTSDYSVDEGSG